MEDFIWYFKNFIKTYVPEKNIPTNKCIQINSIKNYIHVPSKNIQKDFLLIENWLNIKESKLSHKSFQFFIMYAE